jgi:replicative DNA helicase
VITLAWNAQQTARDLAAERKSPAVVGRGSATTESQSQRPPAGPADVRSPLFSRLRYEPRHFFEPIHQKIFEVSSQLVRVGKTATPITLQTFLPPDVDVGGQTVSQYLARLAAEATTVINAGDYGRTVYNLALRRSLITIGEDLVNAAYDAPVDQRPQDQIEEAERNLYEVSERGRYDGGFQRFAQALTTAVEMAANAYQRDNALAGLATGLKSLDGMMGGLQRSDLVILAGRPGMGKTALATSIA